jgi:hypothetical protein
VPAFNFSPLLVAVWALATLAFYSRLQLSSSPPYQHDTRI